MSVGDPMRPCGCGSYLGQCTVPARVVAARYRLNQCPECAKLITEVARLNFELGKARGELEGLRAGWSVSNHEAWEQGYEAGALDECDLGTVTENPFPRPAGGGATSPAGAPRARSR